MNIKNPSYFYKFEDWSGRKFGLKKEDMSGEERLCCSLGAGGHVPRRILNSLQLAMAMLTVDMITQRIRL
jgi:hypothetical protein